MGDSRVFFLLSRGMWGISKGFVLNQDGGDHSHKDFWEYFSTWEQTQVFTGICGIRRIVMQIYTSIKDNFSECLNTYGMLLLKLSLN